MILFRLLVQMGGVKTSFFIEFRFFLNSGFLSGK